MSETKVEQFSEDLLRRVVVTRFAAEQLVLVPVLAVILALILGGIIMLATGVHVDAIGRSYVALFRGSVGSLSAISETLTAAIPLTLCGLGLALGFRTGLFNIGAEGQVLLGGLAAVVVGFSFDGLPIYLHLPLALIAGALTGAAWAAIAGWLKATTGAHEVITTIMLNLIAMRLLDYLLRNPLIQKVGRSDPISKSVLESAELPRLLTWIDPTLRVHAGLILAIAAVILVYWLLYRTTTGFEFRASGLNPDAARYAGMRSSLIIVAVMAFAGALAGLAGANQVLGVLGRASPNFSSGVGFDAIAVALLGRSHPVGVVLAGLLFGALQAGGRQMQVAAGVNIDLIATIQALIIIFIAAPMLVRAVLPWVFSKQRSGHSTMAVTDPVRETHDHLRRRQTLIVGWLLLALAVFVAGVFGLESRDVASFRLSFPGDAFVLPNLVIPSAPYAYVVAALLALFGARQFMRGGARWSSWLLGIGLFLAVTAFLVWATDGKSFSLTGMLQATVVRAVPIAIGGLVGVLCERVAVVNVGIEGMLLAGAFTGAVAGSLFGGVLGIVAAIIVGGLLGLLLAVLVITYRVDQIIAGVAINLFALGLTSYVSSQVLTQHRDLNNVRVFPPINIPFLSDLPFIGPIFFQQTIFVYGAAILIAVSTYYLFYTRSGLRARAVGEHPAAADTLGINVYRLRYINVTIGGMIGGFGGAWFSLGSAGRFDDNMTGGRGFIGLAAMIFGRWHPVGAMMAALVFGFADSLQQKLAILHTPIPSEFLAMAPYLATIVLVAGIIGRARPPAADGKPYVRE